ncbi:MAG: queuosine precursor transporter [Tatlockia sp.]|nr:queuosine precursor transporter [Tatlockia sp.]
MQKFRLYGPLVGLMITVQLTCVVLAYKVISIYGYNFSASGIIYPICFLFAGVLTEAYGFELSGRIIWTQLICQAFFIFFINIFVFFPSPVGDTVYFLYISLYKNMWHVLIASTLSVISSYFINDFIMSKLKIYYCGRLFFLRFFLSTAIATALLVSIAYPINLYGIYSLNEICSIAINTWIYKMAIAILLFPFAATLTRFIKRIEKIDFYDYGISYNPLKVFNTFSQGENRYGK